MHLFEVTATTTVADAKQFLEDKVAFPFHKQVRPRLIFQRKCYYNDSSDTSSS